MSGQTLTDRIAAAQYHVVGSAVSRSVCKASTHELMAPKKKHLDFLIQCTNETNVNIPQLADTLFERAMNSSWIVVFKALVATDHLMCNGNERFIQYLASRNTLFNLSNFLDKSGVQGYDMSTFVRRYSKYLNEKAYSYRQMAFDFTRVKRGNEGLMRSMNVEKLLKALPVLQGQVDALLDFDASPSDLSNGVINAAFSLLFKDMIRLFACYNDGVINLLEKFFELKKTQSKDALELYKKFLTRMTRVAEFFKIAEQIGIDKGDIPDIAQAPSSLLEAMEQHVAIQEAKKGKEGSTGSPHPSRTPTPTLTATTSAAAQPPVGVPPVSEGEASSPPAEASAAGGAAAASPPSGGSAVAPSSYAFLFPWSLFLLSSSPLRPRPLSSPNPPLPSRLPQDPFAPSAGSAGDAAPADLDLFAIKVALPEGAPDAAGVTLPLTPSPAAAVLTPSAPVPPLLTPTAPAAPAASVDLFAGFDLIGDMLLPSMQQQQPQMQPQVLGHAQQATGKLVANDLDSSLANLVGSEGQWSGGEKKLTGGANWQPRAAPPAWAPAPAAPAPAMPGHLARGCQNRPRTQTKSPAPAAPPTAPTQPQHASLSQSPQKGPTKDPLADLNLKDFI
ncbi:unnamed protein product [Lampetra planeri]